MIINGYDHFGGKHGETGALRNILTCEGIVAPHTNKPFTEEMLFGIGGGIGVGYFVYEFKHRPFLILGTRNSWEGSRGFFKGICDRLNIPAPIKETGSKKAAQSNLNSALEDGHPALAWVDLASLPYFFLPADLLKYFSHTVSVCGYDKENDLYFIDDRASTPISISAAAFESARAAIGSNKNAIMITEKPSKLSDLKTAIEQGIKVCCDGLLNPRLKNFGLAALSKWADLIANPKDAKGWPKVFKPGLHMFQALMSTYENIKTVGTGGSAFRLMYADFLDEASDVLKKPSIKQNADLYRNAAQAWSQLADAALPDSIKPFKQARKLASQKSQLFEEKGEPALPKIEKINEELKRLESEVTDSFPLKENEQMDLLNNLKDRILKAHEAEEKAIITLQNELF